MTLETSGSPVAPALETPGLLRRMACWLYEGILLFGVVFIAGYLFGALSQTKNAMDNRNALQAFIFVVFGIYFGWLWSKGQTLAMKTWRIRVVDLILAIVVRSAGAQKNLTTESTENTEKFMWAAGFSP